MSVENRQHGLPRIDDLRAAPARTRFLSIEPLLEDLGQLDLSGIHWVIVGGESGPGARPMKAEWVAIDPRPVPGGRRAVLLQAVGRGPQSEGRPAELDGRTYDEKPSRCLVAAVPGQRVRLAMIDNVKHWGKEPIPA